METIKIKEEEQKILSKYDNIKYKKYLEMENTEENVEALLEEIDDELIQYRDEDDEPLPEWLELERIRDRIYYSYLT